MSIPTETMTIIDTQWRSLHAIAESLNETKKRFGADPDLARNLEQAAHKVDEAYFYVGRARDALVTEYGAITDALGGS